MKIQTLLSCIMLVFLQIGCKPAPVAPQTPNEVIPPVVEQANIANSAPPATVTPAAESCQLRLGFEAWEPYQYVGLDQTPTGLDIELVQAVAKKMNCQITPQQGTWVDLISSLKTGSVDMLLGASKTAAREQYALFSEPYRKEQFVLFVRATDIAGLPQTTMAQFLSAGKTLGIVSEYFYGEELAQLYNDEQIKKHVLEAPLSELNLARLIDEEIDGMLEDRFVAASMLRRKGLDKTVSPHPISLGDNDVYVMFSKTSVKDSQVTAFNEAMSAIRQNGEYDAIVAKYQQ
jgi:polar amino acid transport system substrate-binding protein